MFVIHTVKSSCNHKRLLNDCSALRAVRVHWLSRRARVDAIRILVVICARVLDINGLHRSEAQARCSNLTTRCVVGCTSAQLSAVTIVFVVDEVVSALIEVDINSACISSEGVVQNRVSAKA